MENITRTLYGSYLQSCTLLGLPFDVKPNTTLNQKFSVQASTLPSADQLPKVRYFGIGLGGHRFAVGANGVHKPQTVQHEATDAALYSHLPFVLRALDNDLTTAQAAKYAMRRLETHDGIQYAAYYLKRIDLTGVTPDMQVVSVVDGTSTVTPFVPSAANLNPTPPDLDSSGVNVVTGEYAAAQAVVDISLDEDDVAELINVAKVLYNDEEMAMVSEVALVSGVDKVVTSPAAAGATINFNEVIAAQVVTHINTFFTFKSSSTGANLILDVGATEPLFRLA